MCAIVGALLVGLLTEDKLVAADNLLSHIWSRSHERGRDGRGFTYNADGGTDFFRSTLRAESGSRSTILQDRAQVISFVGNLRAEPTTEFVLNKFADDQQPYDVGDWSVVHNGTIANDKELRTGKLRTQIDSAAIAEILDSNFNGFYPAPSIVGFKQCISLLKGSYAIIARRNSEPEALYVAANYRPIWYIRNEYGYFFASSRHYFPTHCNPRMLEPYTCARFVSYGSKGHIDMESLSLREWSSNRKALVVCSGGLDSVVAATYAQQVMEKDVTLIHFKYGSRAEGPEVEAVRRVSEELGVPLVLFPLPVYSKSDSPLLDENSAVAGGEAGAEFAHEWVPARNLLLLSVATAYAEAHGFETLVLGNNLEEAGAYPDNEPEFIEKFNDLLPFAVGDGKRLRVIMPVGNLMKHEIVKLGKQIDAPMHLTWSCYRAGDTHCGTCGPCYMRRKAFEINGFEEVITYKA